jgi:hypothetical protein
VRQLSVPGRVVFAFAVSLTLAATAGCVNVGDDKGGKPAPGKTPDRRTAVAEHEAGHVMPESRPVPNGRTASVAAESRTTAPEVTPSPSGTPTPVPRPTRVPSRPDEPAGPEPAGPEPTVPVPPPAPTPTPPPEESPTEPTPEPTTPQPTEPTDPPSASSAPEVHAGALRLAHGDERAVGWEPMASPPEGPV